ncbi:hypothetical protein M8J77_003526 [Diaphorina citri]|nr:hypothetical protein M8J77_003526 [Diaphorina citri]
MRSKKVAAWVGFSHPPVSSEEKELPREARTKLAQMRSGFSTLLNSYKSRIDPNIQNEYPLCAGTPHDTNHLFNCPAKPTTLTPIVQQNRPKFLGNSWMPKLLLPLRMFENCSGKRHMRTTQIW